MKKKESGRRKKRRKERGTITTAIDLSWPKGVKDCRIDIVIQLRIFSEARTETDITLLQATQHIQKHTNNHTHQQQGQPQWTAWGGGVSRAAAVPGRWREWLRRAGVGGVPEGATGRPWTLPGGRWWPAVREPPSPRPPLPTCGLLRLTPSTWRRGSGDTGLFYGYDWGVIFEVSLYSER